MPWNRETLTQLRNLVSQDFAGELKGSDSLLRFSNLKIIGDAQAELSNLHYAYLDWIAKQGNPFTATGEYLESWATLKRIFKKPASEASGTVSFVGCKPETIIPSGTPIVRGDGKNYFTTDSCVVGANGIVIANVKAEVDSSGLIGVDGNCPEGTLMTLGVSIPGMQSNGKSGLFTGGADIETDEDFRRRMLFAYQNPPQGGSDVDYVIWATEVPGITRAWVNSSGFGPGTVVVYVMMDKVNSENHGFPVGNDGVASNEERGVMASGDQLIVANYVYPKKPTTALVYICSPDAYYIDFKISGIKNDLRDRVEQAINETLKAYGTPGGRIPINYVWSAISGVSGVAEFILHAPDVDIISPNGSLPVIREIDWGD